jgi:hypothetical protein
MNVERQVKCSLVDKCAKNLFKGGNLQMLHPFLDLNIYDIIMIYDIYDMYPLILEE